MIKDRNQLWKTEKKRVTFNLNYAFAAAKRLLYLPSGLLQKKGFQRD
jgi:hypothetical protein